MAGGRVAFFGFFVVAGHLLSCVFEVHVVFFLLLFSHILKLIVVDVLHVVLEELTVFRELIPEGNE